MSSWDGVNESVDPPRADSGDPASAAGRSGWRQQLQWKTVGWPRHAFPAGTDDPREPSARSQGCWGTRHTKLSAWFVFPCLYSATAG